MWWWKGKKNARSLIKRKIVCDGSVTGLEYVLFTMVKWKSPAGGKATYYSVKEWMLEAFADGDSLLGIHHETLANQIFGILGYVAPLRWHKTVFSFHDIAKHDHLFAMPERWATDEEGEHDDAAGPTKRGFGIKTLINLFLFIKLKFIKSKSKYLSHENALIEWMTYNV